MIEVETKFRLNDKSSIEAKLKELGFTGSEPVSQADRVFLVNSDSFKTFTRGDPVARIRTVDGASSMALKRSINADGDTVEHEMSVRPASAAEGLLQEMGYRVVTSIDKVRSEHRLGDITIALDEVKGLGNFIEIEIVCNKGEESNARSNIIAMARELGLSENEIITKKYDQLISELDKR